MPAPGRVRARPLARTPILKREGQNAHAGAGQPWPWCESSTHSPQLVPIYTASSLRHLIPESPGPHDHWPCQCRTDGDCQYQCTIPSHPPCSPRFYNKGRSFPLPFPGALPSSLLFPFHRIFFLLSFIVRTRQRPKTSTIEIDGPRVQFIHLNLPNMSSKDSIPANDGGEKGVHQVAGVAGVSGADGQAPMGTGDLHNSYDDESPMTRNGLNLESFKCKHYGHGLVELDRAMKTRHLHMIAIGGSIGAGFFVGSGGALYKGVSSALLTNIPFLSFELALGLST